MNLKPLKAEIEKNKKDIQLFIVSILLMLCFIGWFVVPFLNNINEGIDEIWTEDYDEMNITERIDYGIQGYNMASLSLYVHLIWIAMLMLVMAAYFIPTLMLSLFSDNTRHERMKRIENEIKLLKKRK